MAWKVLLTCSWPEWTTHVTCVPSHKPASALFLRMRGVNQENSTMQTRDMSTHNHMSYSYYSKQTFSLTEREPSMLTHMHTPTNLPYTLVLGDGDSNLLGVSRMQCRMWSECWLLIQLALYWSYAIQCNITQLIFDERDYDPGLPFTLLNRL